MRQVYVQTLFHKYFELDVILEAVGGSFHIQFVDNTYEPMTGRHIRGLSPLGACYSQPPQLYIRLSSSMNCYLGQL